MDGEELWLEKRGVGFPHYRVVRRTTPSVGIFEAMFAMLWMIGIAVGPTWLAVVLLVLAVVWVLTLL